MFNEKLTKVIKGNEGRIMKKVICDFKKKSDYLFWNHLSQIKIMICIIQLNLIEVEKNRNK